MSDSSLLNSKIGRYEIQQRIGRGGMAQVFKAFDTNLDRVVAVKVLHEYLSDDPTFKERFEREAKFVASFNHPNIVQIYDFDSVERNGERMYYMVMPYIPGKTLRDVLSDLRQQEKILSTAQIEQITINIANALEYAHKRGMIHRDVKPANILFDEHDQAVLTDFGIARMAASSGLTVEGVTVGTPAYMSPEQVAGEILDARSDVYALGIILYEMITGQLPFEDDGSISILLKHLNEPVPSISNLIHMPNPALDAVIFKALAKHPQDRYQTAAEFAADVKTVFSGGQVDLPLIKSAPSPVITTKADIPVEQRSTRMTQTIQLMTQQIATTIGRSPIGIFAIGLLLIGGIVAIGLFNRIEPAPTLTPTAGSSSMTGDYDSSMTGEEPLYFSISFRANDPELSYWPISDDSTLMRRLTDNDEYLFSSILPGTALTSIFAREYDYSDVSLTMEVTLQAESADATGFGIIFNYQDDDNYSTFTIDGRGRFGIWTKSGPTWTELRGLDEQWTRDPVINPIGESNRLQIEIMDGTYIGFVNDKKLVELSEQPISKGKVGIYLGTTPSQSDVPSTLLIDRFSVFPPEAARSMTGS
ncbi:MAG: protein kinase [Anaerolineae bacterium]|nr:protein kinase [Anaerolineae bacterium]